MRFSVSYAFFWFGWMNKQVSVYLI
jgi:hypothetical protein